MKTDYKSDEAVYFDYAAASPLRECVLESHARLVRDFFYNPHSAHQYSEKCLNAINKARNDLLALLEIDDAEADVVWTSGGTEANNLAVLGSMRNSKKGKHPVLVEKSAHSAVLAPAQALRDEGCKYIPVPVGKDGSILLDEVEQEVADSTAETALVAVCHVNNETGCVMDLKRIRSWMDEHLPQAYLFVDALQSFGKIDIPWHEAGIDYLTVGGRKIGGPACSGALIHRRGLPLKPLMYGGGQQRGVRPGTMDTVSIVEFITAAKEAFEHKYTEYERLKTVNSELRKKLLNSESLSVQMVSPENASPYILNFSLPGYRSAILMRLLAEKNIIIATGSACSTDTVTTSHVLEAMNIERKTASGALRVSFGRHTERNDIDHLLQELVNVTEDY